MKVLDEQETIKPHAPAATPAGEIPGAPEVSVFLPVYNEEPNLRPLHAKLDNALKSLGRSAEIVYVDDGSTDGSLKVLREIAERDPRVRVVALRRNYGQTAAMAAGIDAAKGKVLIPMDADLQNDPADIERLLKKLDEGYDVVSGWRKNRKDKMVTRKIPSMIANRLIVAGRQTLRRDASLHSDLRLMGRRARHRDPGRTSCTHDGQVEVWFVTNVESRLRSDDDQVHGVVSNETDLRVWVVWHAGLCDLDAGGNLRCVSQDLPQGRLRADAFADVGHRDVRRGRAVFTDGTVG
jgi:glycosyltransferase involved in cell wall biosynthesis